LEYEQKQKAQHLTHRREINKIEILNKQREQLWFNFILEKSGLEIDIEGCDLDKLLSLISFD
jgi:hypothetical protein